MRKILLSMFICFLSQLVFGEQSPADKYLLSHKDFVAKALYGPCGHYTFNHKISSFKTHAMSPTFALSLVSLLHEDFLKQNKPDEYKVAELSGGRSSLGCVACIGPRGSPRFGAASGGV